LDSIIARSQRSKEFCNTIVTQADKPAKEALAAGAGEVAEWLKAAVC